MTRGGEWEKKRERKVVWKCCFWLGIFLVVAAVFFLFTHTMFSRTHGNDTKQNQHALWLSEIDRERCKESIVMSLYCRRHVTSYYCCSFICKENVVAQPKAELNLRLKKNPLKTLTKQRNHSINISYTRTNYKIRWKAKSAIPGVSEMITLCFLFCLCNNVISYRCDLIKNVHRDMIPVWSYQRKYEGDDAPKTRRKAENSPIKCIWVQ